ncbi:GTPase domain-containing protein [uncultured Jatrophihabitans sp.]|uniref:GTPase domain-containing protein n=1 Tax=uncultured Jatrophihabitans sp. TaxID=1610747 RepID=UPI0035C9CBC7
MTTRDVRNRYQWQPFALPVLFGEEPPAKDPWPGLLEFVATFGSRTSQIREEALTAAGGTAVAGIEIAQPASGEKSARSATANLNAPMRVVLMGRTMAGKSSLLAAMTGSHLERIGDGRQRFSRDIFGAVSSVSEHVEVVDTPGVGAHGGADDTEIALKAALDADVVVWVNSSDSIQQESAAALKLLGLIGKPIIVAINCRQSLEGIGRLNLLRFPDRVFGNREGLLDEIKRHMADAGVEPLDVVYIHALAAAQALAQGEVQTELHTASRIDDLTDALEKEHAAHSASRRAIRLIDNERQTAEELTESLLQGSINLIARSARDREMINDVHRRMKRLVLTAGESMASDVESAVGRRRDWHLIVTDFGKTVQSDWADEVRLMQEELTRSLGSRLTALIADLKSTIADADTEWTSVSADHFALRDLKDFNGVWGNRIARAGVGVAGATLGLSGGAVLGAQIGGALGLAGGPLAILTAGAGLFVGGIAGLAAGQIKSLVDHIFLGKDGVLRKRREQVAKQVGPILDDIEHEYQKAITAYLGGLRSGLEGELARSDEQSASLERLSSHWTVQAKHLRTLVRDMDRETISTLLRVNGRERLARSVKRATRVPGVCILAEFDDSAFWESWLFPPDLGEVLAGGTSLWSNYESAGASGYALGLVEAAKVHLVKTDGGSATLRIHEDIPPAITTVWAEGLTAHTGRNIQIETTRRTGSR